MFDDTDAQILQLFRDWVSAERLSEELGETIVTGAEEAAVDPTKERDDVVAAFNQACDRATDIIEAISNVPAASATGLAIKIFLSHHLERGGQCKDAPALAAFFGQDDELSIDQLLARSMIEDAAHFVPELKPLSAAVIGAGVVGFGAYRA